MGRGTWFVDELCRNSVRGSSAVRDTVYRRVWGHFMVLVK